MDERKMDALIAERAAVETRATLDVSREFDLDQLVELMRQPVRAVHTCISKGQAQTLCKQLLAQNLCLQMERQTLQKEVAALRYREKH